MSTGAATTSIADVYAQALFELACERDQREAVGAELSDLGEVLKQVATLQKFLENPTVSRQEKQQCLVRAFAEKVSPLAYHFLQVLARKDRLAELARAIEAYKRLDDAYVGRVEGRLITAVAMDEEAIAAVARKFSDKLGKQVHLVLEVDPEIIGGMKVEIAGEIYDGSVASDLQRFGRRLSDMLMTRLTSV